MRSHDLASAIVDHTQIFYMHTHFGVESNNTSPKPWREVQAVCMPVPVLSLCVCMLKSVSGAVNVGTRSSGPRQ